MGVMVMDAFRVFAFHLEPDDALVPPEFVCGNPGHVFSKARPGTGLFGHLFVVLALEQEIQPRTGSRLGNGDQRTIPMPEARERS